MEETLKEYFIEVCRQGGICDEGMTRVSGAPDFRALVDYYIANPDWAMERNIPNLDMLRNLSAEHGLEDMGIFVDREFCGEILDKRLVYIFHHCRGTVKVRFNYADALMPMLYVCNGSRLRIAGAPPACEDVKIGKQLRRMECPVYVFGCNDVSAHSNKWVKFNRYNSVVK